MNSILNSTSHHTTYSVAFIAGFQLLVTLGLCYGLTTVGFFIGVGVSPFHFPLFFLGAALLSFFIFDKKKSLKAVVINALICFISIAIGKWILDISSDGQYYHQQMIYAFMTGWNPIYHPIRDDLIIWSSHYAHTIELIASTIASTTNDIEAGKAVNLLLIISTGFIVYGYSRQFLSFSRWHSLALTLLTALNPIALFQCLTYYIDFAIYYYLVLTIIFSLPFIKGKPSIIDKIGLATTIILAVSTKFNAFFYEGFAIATILIATYLFGNQKNIKPYFLFTFITALLAVAIFGFHPYLTNWYCDGNPVYPLMGEGKIDIMLKNTPEEYFGHNRIENFFISYFSKPTQFVVPITDTRHAGFGPFFPIILLLSLFLISYHCITNRDWLSGYATFAILLSCFCFEQSWWARYIPQLWLIVPLSYYVTCKIDNLPIKFVRESLAPVVTAISLIYLSFNLGNYIFFSQYRRIIANTYKDKELVIAGCMIQEYQWLELHGVKVRRTEFEDQAYQPRLSYIYRGWNATDGKPYLVLSEEESKEILKKFDEDPIVNFVNNNRLFYLDCVHSIKHLFQN